jgi:hypothetical protein
VGEAFVWPKMRLLAWLGAGLFCCALVAAAARLAPGVALSPRPAFALAFAAVSFEILLVARAAPLLRGPPLWGILLFTFGALTLVSGARLTGESAGIASAALLWTATGLGAGLGARIDKAGHMLPVAAVSGLADLWSVYDPAGPSAALARKVTEEPDRVSAFALSFPMLGTTHIPAIIGAGDVLFCALYLAVFERHRLPVWKALVALSGGFVLALFGLLWLERPLPLLPLLGGAIVLSDARARSLDAREGRTVLVVLALLGTLILVRSWR